VCSNVVRMMRYFSLIFLASILTNCTKSSRTPYLPPPGGSPKIFDSYSTTGASFLSRGWIRGYDMSGVSFNDKRTCTLITPRHVVMAKHYKRPVNSKVIFHDRKGKRCVRYIHQIQDCKGDVAVGLLDEPVPIGYTSYALPSVQSDHQALINRPLAVTDQNKMVFFHRVASIANGRLMMKFDPEARHGMAKKLVVGDSGNPAFFITDQKLVLAETHHIGGPGAGPYFGDPAVQQSVIKAVKDLDPNYQISTQTVTP